MINLAVINLKKLIKGIIKIIIVTLIVAMIFKFIKIIKNINFSEVLKIKTESFEKDIIQTSLVALDENNQDSKKIGQKILESELTSLSYTEENIIKEDDENKEKTEDENVKKIEESIKIEKVANHVNSINNMDLRNKTTMVIEENNKIDKYTNNYENVKIKNETAFDLTEEMLLPNIELSNKKDIIIFHTHTCESYTPTEKNNYTQTGNYRTTDLNFTVVRVGEELSYCLRNKNYNVIHNTDYHDYPAYNGSYSRSFTTVKNILSQNNNNTQLVIDLHRDALGNNSSYAPSVLIGNEKVAQLMFVLGSNGGGLNHDNWCTNLKLAILIQKKANEMYPGLFKPIILRNSRYNQNLADGACIIEVGATGNTLEEAIGSMKYLAEVISEVMK